MHFIVNNRPRWGEMGGDPLAPTMNSHDLCEQRIALIDLLHAMWNTQNVAGVLACFSEDVVFRIVCPPRHASIVYEGHHQLRAFVEQTIPGYHVRARSHHVVDDRVIWMATVTSDQLRQVGVDAIRDRHEAVIRKGKIVAYTVTMLPEAVATLDTATDWSLEYLAQLGAD